MIALEDVDTIYRIPSVLHAQGLDDIVVERFGLECGQADLSEWDRVVDAKLNPEREVTIAMVGKYMELLDAYKSLIEAMTHAGIQSRTKVNLRYIDSEDIEQQGTSLLEGVDAILVPGGFGLRGVEGKISTVQYARENKIPTWASAWACRSRSSNTPATCSAGATPTPPSSTSPAAIRWSA